MFLQVWKQTENNGNGFDINTKWKNKNYRYWKNNQSIDIKQKHFKKLSIEFHHS